MAIHDSKTITVRGKDVTVFGEKVAETRYLFTGIHGNIVRQLNVAFGDREGNIAGNDAPTVQKGIDQARQSVAEIVAGIVEHNELIGGID